jgi:murein L,D-transpeptidase YafK
MIKRIILFIVSIIVFMAGCMLYGVIINLRENTLAEELRARNMASVKSPVIRISRKDYTLGLYDGDTLLVKSYRAVFGRNPLPKRLADDMGTPVGDYEVCDIDTNSIYYRFVKINYPNLQDLNDAKNRGVISREDFENLRYQSDLNQSPRADTKLGGNIGIHGLGRLNFLFKNLPFVFNWTDGSIAISNESMDELFPFLQKGTRVIISE